MSPERAVPGLQPAPALACTLEGSRPIRLDGLCLCPAGALFPRNPPKHHGHASLPLSRRLCPLLCTDWPSAVGRDPADSSHFTPWATHSCCTNCLGLVEHSESALDLDLALPSHRSKQTPRALSGFPQFPHLLSGDLDPRRGSAPQASILHTGPVAPEASQSHAPKGPPEVPTGSRPEQQSFHPQVLLEASQELEYLVSGSLGLGFQVSGSLVLGFQVSESQVLESLVLGSLVSEFQVLGAWISQVDQLSLAMCAHVCLCVQERYVRNYCQDFPILLNTSPFYPLLSIPLVIFSLLGYN